MIRREFVGLMAAVSIFPSARTAVACEIHELGLPSSAMEDLRRFGNAAIEDAELLNELPLEHVSPAFLFTPR